MLKFIVFVKLWLIH